MNILPNDILIRETPNGTTVWVSQRLVVERCGVSDEVIRDARKRHKASLPESWQSASGSGDFLLGDSGKSWRWGRKGGQYYYDVDRIPNRKPCYYRDQLPAKDELIVQVDENHLRSSRARKAEQLTQITEAVAAFYSEEDVRWLNGRSGYSLNVSTCRDYGRAIAWCRFINATLRRTAHESYGCATKEAFYERCADIIGAQKIANLRISTSASLRKKLIGFPIEVEDQRRWIISKKIGNDNRKVVGKYQIVDVETGEVHDFDIHQAVMYNAYMNIDDPRKEYQETLYNEQYVPMMESFGETPVALRTFNSHLTRFCNRLKTGLQRHGIEWYKKQMLTYIPSEKLTYSHSLFCGDGSGLIGYRHWGRVKGDDGKVRNEIKIKNLYAMLITDVASGYIAGYDFAAEGSTTETNDMVREAIRMAVRRGGNQTMFEFVSDNHGAFTDGGQKEFLRSVFNVVRTIEAKNSQANPAEMQFRLFKNSTLRSYKNFIRSSHGSMSVDSRANLDGVNKSDYPTYPEVIVQVREAIERWNRTPRGDGRTPEQLFIENKHADCRAMPEIQLRLIMGHHTRVEVTRMRGFVDVEHAGKDYKFEISDYTIAAQKISQATGYGYDAVVYVTWDETGADLYSSDGRYILTCLPVCRANQSHKERTPAQQDAQRHLSARKQAQLEAAASFGGKVLDVMETISSGNGYDADVALGGNKESVNEAYEAAMDDAISSRVAKPKKPIQIPSEISDPKKAARERFIFGTT